MHSKKFHWLFSIAHIIIINDVRVHYKENIFCIKIYPETEIYLYLNIIYRACMNFYF